VAVVIPTGWAVALGVLVVLLLLGWYLTFFAGRLDRLHHRVEGARSALDNQLLRRATAAAELAASGLLDPATSVLLAGAAADAVGAGEASSWDEQPLEGGHGEREAAESDLSRTLRAALDTEQVRMLRADPLGADLLAALDAACLRVRLARRFHNDAVAQAQRVRGKRVVKAARLSGRAPMPQTFEMDDEPPALTTA
jgi:hypothetical protein